MIDQTRPFSDHTTVDCAGRTRTGAKCRNWQWFPFVDAPADWRCHLHAIGATS